MGFKRKRSVSTSPMSISSFGSAPTPEAQSPTPMPDNYANRMDMDMDIDLAPVSRFQFGSSNSLNSRWSHRLDSSDMGSRTRKRFRDNRPDERVVHETTLQKLFLAQRVQPHASPILSAPIQPAIQAPQPPAPVQKSTLHSFWKLPAPPAQAPPPTIRVQHFQDAPRCEDCDAPLRDEVDGMDVDVDGDVDAGGAANRFACCGCGRRVCGTCAVVKGERCCLTCVGTGTKDGRWW
ncbi:hypothetical protein B0J11DRAFT_73417 [Dendryphion nanum]|uniref:Uncharacterized protein n=1 Tax=Dendryphion nanum TaxID=256645 RepID=A0A9P9IHS1_9PLEO|nr:hypothetical protein B0J11DRAFT_73417 [Dendryphion nanum]